MTFATPPDDSWTWYKTSYETLMALARAKIAVELEREENYIKEMSLDHDLGGDDTSRPIVLWMCEYNFWPVEVRVHSDNPVGIEWLKGMIERYKT